MNEFADNKVYGINGTNGKHNYVYSIIQKTILHSRLNSLIEYLTGLCYISDLYVHIPSIMSIMKTFSDHLLIQGPRLKVVLGDEIEHW